MSVHASLPQPNVQHPDSRQTDPQQNDRISLSERVRDLTLPSLSQQSDRAQQSNRAESGEVTLATGTFVKPAGILGFGAPAEHELKLIADVEVDRLTYDHNSVHLRSGNQKFSFNGLSPKAKAELIDLFTGSSNENVEREHARRGDQWQLMSPTTWMPKLADDRYNRTSQGSDPADTISRMKDYSEIVLKQPVVANVEVRAALELNNGSENLKTETWVEKSGVVRQNGFSVTTLPSTSAFRTSPDSVRE